MVKSRPVENSVYEWVAAGGLSLRSPPISARAMRDARMMRSDCSKIGQRFCLAHSGLPGAFGEKSHQRTRYHNARMNRWKSNLISFNERLPLLYILMINYPF